LRRRISEELLSSPPPQREDLSVTIIEGERLVPPPLLDSRPSGPTLCEPASGSLPCEATIYWEPLKDVYSHALASPEAEIAGLLLGEPFTADAAGMLVVHVRTALRFVNAVGYRSRVTVNQGDWADLYEQMRSQYPGALVVGWYHSHPGWGAFFSSNDRCVHKAFFQEPWQIGLVVDPLTAELACFCWSHDETLDACRLRLAIVPSLGDLGGLEAGPLVPRAVPGRSPDQPALAGIGEGAAGSSSNVAVSSGGDT
jgi:proteasome lid subunit RPN8/RPN11